MNEILSKIEKEKIIDLNKELINTELNESEILLLSTYIYTNNIDMVRDANEILKSDAEISTYTKDYLKELKHREKIDEVYDSLINIAIEQVIRNIKRDYSFIELINETYLYVAEYINKYYDKLLLKYNKNQISQIFRIYVSIKILSYQIKQEKEDFNSKMSLILYLKIKEEIEKGQELENILSDMQIDKDYYDILEDMYSYMEIESEETIDYYAENIKNDYSEYSKTFLFNYIEETLLIHYLSLDNIKYSKKEMIEKLNISEKEFLETFDNILRKLSEVEEK